eukprot:11282980-Prorocentrum_lima.AAC.1
MTSSLVGSEMCIRDRSLTPGRQNGNMYICTDPKDFEIKIRPGATSVHAVSYTHLTLPTICSV